MKTTMQSLAGPDTIRVMLIASKDAKKQCEVDITHMTLGEVRVHIRMQEDQGRSWEHQVIKSYKFPEFAKKEKGGL